MSFWKRLFGSSPPQDLRDLNKFVNTQIKYKPEFKEDGMVRRWSEALKYGADCETYAYWKAAMAHKLPGKKYKARLVFVEVIRTKEAHAVCEVIDGENVWILDNMVSSVQSKETAKKRLNFDRYQKTNTKVWSYSWEHQMKELLPL